MLNFFRFLRVTKHFGNVVFYLMAVIVCREARATNISFMPGDAFFHAELREDFIENLSEKSNNIRFGYAEPSWMGLGDMGSYAGFTFLQVEDVNAEMIVNLRKAYRHARSYYAYKKVEIYFDKDGKRGEQEINPLHLFIYNRNVDWTHQRMAQKYNRDWPNWPPEAIQKIGTGFGEYIGPADEYHPFIKTYEAAVEDRQYAHLFSPLKVVVPKNVKWAMPVVPPIKEPVVAKAKDIQIVILPENKLKAYYKRKPNNDFYQITVDSFKVLSWNEEQEIIEKDFSAIEKERDKSEAEK